MQVITTHDGRSLACDEVGNPNGPLVIHNHGGPSSRLEARLFSGAASKHVLRLLCVDRQASDGQARKTRAAMPGGRSER
ncbi:hypothetical protein [Pseudorhodoplanes sp.]|uniref:hypothetical protein n=1 Tax=Pseudorhodoplanes sp. TaxID=1934341 RepID=UPI002CE63C16|nr:hypothetical protein [Pseudorhodoplanes sp.]HWV52093.1 hypothetical protein [Pseudorhodoplanes sp.]